MCKKFLISIVSLLCLTSLALGADANVIQTSTAPVIDGTVDAAWSGAAEYAITRVIGGTVSSNADLSGTWRAMWDSTNLYYLVDVNDDALMNDSTDSWDDDSVELYIDADNSKGTSYDGVDDYQLVFRWNDATVHLGVNSATNITGVTFAMVAKTGGYRFEVRIPWSTLGETPTVGKLIGTDIHVNDDDDGAARDGKKSWFATADNSWTNPSTFATASLTSALPQPPGQASSPSPANGATSVSTTADLSWTAGSGATSHDVYFGTLTSPPFIGNQAGTTYDTGTMAAVTTYYWRIDEKNAGGTTTGTVWNFTTTGGAAIPTFVAAGAVASGTGAITPALPSGIATNDILLLFLETANQAISISNQNGGTWTAVTNSPQGTGTAGGSSATRLTVFWSRYNGTQGAPTTSDSGNHQIGRMIAVRGAITSGNPWDVTAGGVESTSDTSGSIPGATTTVANTLVVAAIATALPDASGTANFSAWANSNLTGITERTDNTVTAGNGGGLGIATGEKATAGAYGNTTVTAATSAVKGMMSIALKGGTAPPGQASNPSPANGATSVSVTTDLSWTAGSGATSHDVYFGTASTPPFIQNQTGTTYDTGTMANNTTYYWRIDEKNAAGTTTGIVWSFTTIVAVPGQASNPSPANGATGISTTADLSWTAGSGATSHDVYFGTASTPPFIQNQAGTTYDTGTMANSTTYYWRINEKNAGGTTTGTVWSFTTQAVAAPGQASNPSPANAATGVGTTTDLSWTAGSGATSHDVYFGTASPGTFRGNQAGTTYDTGTMANSTTYYWRIDEKNAGGTTAGAVWSFATAGAGGQTTLNPTADASSQSGNCDTGSLSFSLWNHIFMKFDLASVPTPVTSAVLRLYYESAQALTIYVNDASTDTWTECGTLPTQGSTQMASVSATGAGWYEFTVTSYVAAQATGDDVITFCISNSHSNWWSMCAREGANPPQLVVQYGGGGPPGQATNPNPANGATGVGTTATLSWTAGSGATSRDVYFGTPTTPPFIQNQTATTYNPGTMANSTTYRWRIDEKNANGTTTGVVWSFTTAAAVPPGQASSPSPANGATGVSTSVTVSWTAGSGATSHDVYFGTPTTPPFIQNQTATTYSPGALANSTTYRWRIDEKNAYGTTTGVVWSFTTGSGYTGMTVGCNFWRIDWGAGGWNHYFASGVDWATTTNPWNPTFVSELQQAKMKCLRFMDWVITNGSAVQNWSQRIPKTANHYYAGNTVPLLNSDGSSAGNGYGVAYEWQIDLCNRIGADMWVTVPHAATADYQHQLATLIYNNLNSNLKVYVEYSNECWNWGFYQTTYCDNQSTAVGIRDLDVGQYCEPWWKYKIYASVRLWQQFESVFGAGSPRLVKVVGCQVGYNWGGYDYNHQIIGELACLNNSTINPSGIMPNVWAAAPYWGTSVGDVGDLMHWAHNSLVGTGIKLVCYEGGSDNYSDPRGCTTAQVDPAQEQLYIDALNAIEPYCEGVFNQYCFVGDCWGLKVSTGQAPSAAPKWRGATTWINARY